MIRITILMILISLTTFGQATEVVILGGIQDNNPNTNNVLQDAIYNPNNLNGNGTITIKGDVTIKEDFTIPEGINLNFFKGNKLIIENTAKLTINGNITAGLYPIFDGLGTISGTPQIEYLYPQWFGVKPNNSNFNSTIAFQKTINTSIDIGVPIKLPVGTYYVDELYINNGTKPFKIVGSLTDRTNQLIGSTLELINKPTNTILFHLGYDGTSNKRSVNAHIEGINFRGNNRNFNTYAIKGGDDDSVSTWVQRIVIDNCTFNDFVYGIYLGGYSDGLTLSQLKFETVNRCMYIKKGDGTRISNIVAEPYVDYVLHSVQSMGLVFSDAIVRGAKSELNNNLTVPFIIEGIKGPITNHDGPVEIKNVHIETSNGVGIIADATRVTFENIFFQLVQDLEQQSHTITLLNSQIQPVDCRFINFTIQRENPIKEDKQDIFVNTYGPGQQYNLIESNYNGYGYCKPSNLLVQNWNIDPITDIYDRTGNGVFSYNINGRTEKNYIGENPSKYLDLTESKFEISEATGSIQVTGTGGPQTIKLIKTSVPWEGTLKVLMYDVNNSNASRSQTYKVSGVYSNLNGNSGFTSTTIGNEGFANFLTTPDLLGPQSGTEDFNSSIDFKFIGDNNITYKLIYHFEGISKP
ncbi:hypothetical protein [Aquimarina sp. AU474]|uniref:hypothetical protein n=1 Tax=Aquimarina sp. AU474 TaxID=2108529 RepID=UPI00135ADFAB|nr:hypothetical protein [Aquimarina sp. AU474]